MLAFSSFTLALYLLMNSTAAQNSEITCPATGFTVGVNATVTCKVNKPDFDSVCTLPATLITFYFTPSNGSKTVWCSSSYTTCSNTGTTQVACGTCSCGCETDYGIFLTHRLDFIPKSAHAAGNFSCEVTCFNSGNLPTLKNNNCDQVTVAPPGTSAPGCPICKKGTDCDKPDWICLLFLLLLIPIVILIIILWYFFVHKPKTGDNCGNKKAEEGGQKGSPKNQQTSNGTNPADGKGSPQNQQTTNGNRTADGKGSTQNQETTNGNKTADGKRSGQRDNKVGTGHVATNGAHNGEKVSKPVQETELTKVKETSSAPSGEEETSLNGTS